MSLPVYIDKSEVYSRFEAMRGDGKKGPHEAAPVLLVAGITGWCLPAYRFGKILPTEPTTFPCSGTARRQPGRVTPSPCSLIRSDFARWRARTTTTPAVRARSGHSGGSGATMDLRVRWRRPADLAALRMPINRTTTTPAVHAR